MKLLKVRVKKFLNKSPRIKSALILLMRPAQIRSALRRRIPIVSLCYRLNEMGVMLMIRAKKMVQSHYPSIPVEESPDRLLVLHKKVSHEISKQRKEYQCYQYFEGYPYQGLMTLGILGARGTEERFENYELAEFISKNDYILDIGCNCGFMSIYTAYRTGCKADAIDINEYMINIGKHCVEYFNLFHLVHLRTQAFQDFVPDKKYTVVFSFAAHWTTDERHRPDFDNYMLRLYSLLSDNGLLFFETHGFEVGNKEFYDKLEKQRRHFSWEGSKILEKGQREFFVMRKIPKVNS